MAERPSGEKASKKKKKLGVAKEKKVAAKATSVAVEEATKPAAKKLKKKKKKALETPQKAAKRKKTAEEEEEAPPKQEDTNEEEEPREESNMDDAEAAARETEEDDDVEVEKLESSITKEATPTETETEKKTKPSMFSSQTFDALPLTDGTRAALTAMGLSRMTKIQAKAIPPLLEGRDVLGKAKTGSGKTLAFLIPLVELLSKTRFQRRNGTGAIVISPTRELALQISGVLKELLEKGKHSGHTHGVAIGGANRKSEAEKLSKGVCALVATPGRLLDHLQNTKNFVTRHLCLLCVDEADRLLDIGFEEDIKNIVRILPSKTRQTAMFSATQTQRVEDLAALALKDDNPVYVGVDDLDQDSTVETLEQGYVVVRPEDRFRLLLTFLKRHVTKHKIMVFFSSCNAVRYYSDLLNYVDVKVNDIHGKQKQAKRTATFFDFCKQKVGVLLCPDSYRSTDVAARGLDIPSVDWIVQYDPPDDPREYIHRVGRTARGATGAGKALLFLIPEELKFLKFLKAAKVKLKEYDFPSHKIANVQNALTRLVERNYYLHKAARDAYRSYLLAYASHSHKDVFNVHALDLASVAKAFGFAVPPRIDLNLSARGDRAAQRKQSHKRKRSSGDESSAVTGSLEESTTKKKMHARKSGHAFSADNPYGVKAADDRRQFSR